MLGHAGKYAGLLSGFPPAQAPVDPLPGSYVLLDTRIAAQSATVDFFLVPGFGDYLFLITECNPASDGANFRGRVALSNGGGLFSAGGIYGTTVFDGVNATAAAAEWSFGPQVTAANARNLSAAMHLFDPLLPRYMYGHLTQVWTPNNDNEAIRADEWGIIARQQAGVIGARFYFSTGNIARGTFRMYGVKK